jgi:aspartate kinase
LENKTLVMKFGGTSVGTAQAMGQTVKIIQDTHQEWNRLVVITSALSGVTTLLLDSAKSASQGDFPSFQQAIHQLRTIHHDMIDSLITDLARQAQLKQDINHLISEFSNLCEAIAVLGEATPRALDAVAALGERMSTRILTATLEAEGTAAQLVEATQLIITDARYQSANPDIEETTRRTHQILSPILSQGTIPIVTGFIGATKEGTTTTLGRGGSDYSAAILAAALPAQEVWIWTDVDGVMTADPRIVPNAITIPEISYREVAELAYFGAKVLHPKTIRPVIEASIGLRVCNTFNPNHPGTRLLATIASIPKHEREALDVVKAVTLIRGLKLITLEGRGMLGVPGVAARTFGAVAETGTSVPLISQASSEQSICFAVPAESSARVLSSLEKAFASELTRRDIDRVWATEEVVIVTVVGEGMRTTPGVAGRVFSALGNQCVNIIAIAQGSSEVSISLIVDAADAEKAVRTLHSLIIKE